MNYEIDLINSGSDANGTGSDIGTAPKQYPIYTGDINDIVSYSINNGYIDFYITGEYAIQAKLIRQNYSDKNITLAYDSNTQYINLTRNVSDDNLDNIIYNAYSIRVYIDDKIFGTRIKSPVTISQGNVDLGTIRIGSGTVKLKRDLTNSITISCDEYEPLTIDNLDKNVDNSISTIITLDKDLTKLTPANIKTEYTIRLRPYDTKGDIYNYMVWQYGDESSAMSYFGTEGYVNFNMNFGKSSVIVIQKAQKMSNGSLSIDSDLPIVSMYDKYLYRLPSTPPSNLDYNVLIPNKDTLDKFNITCKLTGNTSSLINIASSNIDIIDYDDNNDTQNDVLLYEKSVLQNNNGLSDEIVFTIYNRTQNGVRVILKGSEFYDSYESDIINSTTDLFIDIKPGSSTDIPDASSSPDGDTTTANPGADTTQL